MDTPTTMAPAPPVEKIEHEEHDWTINHLTLPRELAFLSVVSSTQLFTQIGLAMSIAPLHIIGKDLGIDDRPGLLSWSPAAYSLTVGTFILIAGRVGDLYGHKKAVLAGWGWYAVFSLIGGESWGSLLSQIEISVPNP
jgi:MFS family permease